ncbi:NRDE family protein [Aestuariirhabdus litorea]|uniref:NRDE family protein n=1 Tax=Aestuariirhabdus litorea TaxID=2528527 RepID=A0A3P3VK30_9GAMM|nr:NRDE family protein [Aestuariirhabdus litorea]RRJ83091.1 NRDE family protein [Aestuariirhabdus litorea]RWW93248.1 NRDE family protein [Endozoicomonadaceae bacterium GTF-13]
MCLIVFDYHPDSRQLLRLAANRDEFYRRPSQMAHRWEEAPHLLAGRDIEKGGTWLGVSEQGHFAAVTNFREVPAREAPRSRGRLTAEFLKGELGALDYLRQLEPEADQYPGFNLLLGDPQGLFYFSNRENRIRRLAAGRYGLSNHLLDTPWPKLVAAKQRLDGAHNHSRLQQLLRDPAKPEDAALPDTGIGLGWERLLSSCFIESEHYGTRTATSLIIEANGQTSLQEQHFGSRGIALDSNHHSLRFERPWQHDA